MRGGIKKAIYLQKLRREVFNREVLELEQCVVVCWLVYACLAVVGVVNGITLKLSFKTPEMRGKKWNEKKDTLRNSSCGSESWCGMDVAFVGSLSLLLLLLTGFLFLSICLYLIWNGWCRNFRLILKKKDSPQSLVTEKWEEWWAGTNFFSIFYHTLNRDWISHPSAWLRR